jgi:hypothetical protein
MNRQETDRIRRLILGVRQIPLKSLWPEEIEYNASDPRINNGSLELAGFGLERSGHFEGSRVPKQ